MIIFIGKDDGVYQTLFQRVIDKDWNLYWQLSLFDFYLMEKEQGEDLL